MASRFHLVTNDAPQRVKRKARPGGRPFVTAEAVIARLHRDFPEDMALLAE